MPLDSDIVKQFKTFGSNVLKPEYGIALLLTGLLWVLIRLIRKGEKLLRQLIDQHTTFLSMPVMFRGVTLIQGSTLEAGAKTFIRAISIAAIVLVIYTYFSMLFSIFEATRGYASMLFQFVMGIIMPMWHNFVAYLPNLLSIVIICGAGYYFLKLLQTIFSAIADGKLVFEGFYREWTKPTYTLLRLLVIAFILALIFPLLPGFNSPAFQGISVFVGVLLSLGSSSAIANMIAGIVLIYTRAFEIGDRIETNGIMGDVVDKALLVTRIKTIKNVEVTMPNSMVLGSSTKNFTKEAQQGGLILNTSVTIGYDVPWRQVHELLIQAALATGDILETPKPFVFQTSLDDFFVSYELNAYTRDASKMALIYSNLHQQIQDAFNQAGVEIMSPHYRAIRDGNASTVVPPQG